MHASAVGPGKRTFRLMCISRRIPCDLQCASDVHQRCIRCASACIAHASERYRNGIGECIPPAGAIFIASALVPAGRMHPPRWRDIYCISPRCISTPRNVHQECIRSASRCISSVSGAYQKCISPNHMCIRHASESLISCDCIRVTFDFYGFRCVHQRMAPRCIRRGGG